MDLQLQLIRFRKKFMEFMSFYSTIPCTFLVQLLLVYDY